MRIRNGRLLAERKEERNEAKKKIEEKEIKVREDTVKPLMQFFSRNQRKLKKRSVRRL